MTTLLTGYNVEKPATPATLNGRIYLTNDFDRPKVWDGLSAALRDAGIAAPTAAIGAPTSAAGNVTIGVHLVRYRYLDSASPGGQYRSNPSAALSQSVVTTAKKLTFSVTDAGGGGAIIRSTDPKVTTIQLEATLVAGSDYYVVTTIANSGVASVDYDVSDTLLVANDAVANFDDFGHEQPPIGAILCESRNYAFLGGYHQRTRTVTTNGTTTVTGTNFSTLWAGRLIRFGSDTAAYEILSVASATSLTLTTVYAGSGSVSATIYSKSPNRIYWSKPAFPESWKAASRSRDVLNGKGDRLVGMLDFNGELMLFGLRSMQRLVWDSDPALGELNTIAGEFGVWNQRCLLSIDGAVYGWGANGAWMMTGGRPRWLSRAIDPRWRALIDASRSDQFFADYEPVQKVVRWFFVATGDTAPHDTISFDLARNEWSQDEWRQGIDASATVSLSTGLLNSVLSDATSGYTWTFTGATDGAPASTSGAYTASVGSTLTASVVTASLPTGAAGTDLRGAILYRPATSESVLIASNTVDTITHAAYATAVAAGESLYAGAIPWAITSEWAIGEDPSEKTRPAYLHLHFVPSSTGAVRVAVYRDYSDTPIVFTSNASDRYPDAITVGNGGSYVEVALTGGTAEDGFVPVPLPADWSRALRYEITCLSPAGTLRLLDASFAVTDKRQVGSGDGE